LEPSGLREEFLSFPKKRFSSGSRRISKSILKLVTSNFELKLHTSLSVRLKLRFGSSVTV
jgi:hypothetical protein